jgi:hypothetical protein
MVSNEDTFHIKVGALDEIYNFHLKRIFYVTSNKKYTIILKT